jgi:hypothetical protein
VYAGKGPSHLADEPATDHASAVREHT